MQRLLARLIAGALRDSAALQSPSPPLGGIEGFDQIGRLRRVTARHIGRRPHRCSRDQPCSRRNASTGGGMQRQHRCGPGRWSLASRSPSWFREARAGRQRRCHAGDSLGAVGSGGKGDANRGTARRIRCAVGWPAGWLLVRLKLTIRHPTSSDALPRPLFPGHHRRMRARLVRCRRFHSRPLALSSRGGGVVPRSGGCQRMRFGLIRVVRGCGSSTGSGRSWGRAEGVPRSPRTGPFG